MSLLENEKSSLLDSVCSQLIQHPEVFFARFVNHHGRTAYGDSKSPSKMDEKRMEMFLMEVALDFSMKNEFNDTLGPVEYVVTKRKEADIVCIPMDNLILVLIISNQNSNEQTLKKIFETLNKFAEVNTLHELV